MNDATTFDYKDARSTYDVDHAPEFLELMLDENLVYTCGYFLRDDWTLKEAQLAKIDLILDKCDTTPGQTVLEVGCGCGAAAYRAAEKYKVNVVALNPSIEQANVARERASRLPPGSGAVEVHSHGWEEWNGSVDRIMSMGALEHIGPKNYEAFFKRCRQSLPEGGKLVVHCIVNYDIDTLEKQGIEITQETIDFTKFISREVFPGCGLKSPNRIARRAADGGFLCEQKHTFGLYYAKTLDIWAANLEANRERAVALRSQETYDRYMKYLHGCAREFRKGVIDLCQFVFRAI